LDITREQVANVIGKHAENLVYQFCTVRPRRSYILSGVGDAKQLAAIEYANLMEQSQRLSIDMSYVSQLKNIMESK